MKKILTFCLCFLFISVVNAEKCTVVTGDGSHIGDEIQCGSEHFYIMNRNNDKTELLAKYNLLVGDEINLITPTEEDYDEFYDNEDNYDKDFCFEFAKDKGYDPYYTVEAYDFVTDDFLGCRVYEKIDYERVLQDEKAVGTYLENGKSRLPLYGIVYMVPEWGYDYIHDDILHINEYDDEGNLIIEGSSIEEYITGYKKELKNQGINALSVGMPVLDKSIDFLETISGKTFDFALEHIDDYNNPLVYWTDRMDIKSYVPEQYKWFYDRTYWLGSGFALYDIPNSFADYYISNEGYLCAIGRGECVYLPYPIGNGLRPLVTINTADINFVIETKTDGNGTVESEKVTAAEGEVIKFTVTPNDGYVLGEVRVTDALGNVVVFKDNTFTMPNANVLIEAVFVLAEQNPNTGDIALITISAILMICTIAVMLNYKKLKFLE